MRNLEVMYGVTKKDLANMVTSESLESAVGKTIMVKGVAIGMDKDQDGKDVRCGYLLSEDTIYSTISDTAIRSIEMYPEIMEEENLKELEVLISKRSAKSGRDFLVLFVK